MTLEDPIHIEDVRTTLHAEQLVNDAENSLKSTQI